MSTPRHMVPNGAALTNIPSLAVVLFVMVTPVLKAPYMIQLLVPVSPQRKTVNFAKTRPEVVLPTL